MIEFVTFAQGIATLAGSAATTWTAIKYVWKPWQKKRESSKAFRNNCEFIAKEMRPNGGGSMRDSVEGLKASIDAMLATMTRLDQRQISFANQSDKGIFEADANGDCIFINRTLCRISGRSSDEAYGKGWKAFIAPQDRERVVAEWFTCVKEKRDFSLSYHFIKPDMSQIRVNCHAHQLKDVKGQHIGHLGFVVPIRETDPGL